MKRAYKPGPGLTAEWTRTSEFSANGRNIERGTELSIKGESGRFRFIEHVRTPDGSEWITVYGGDSNLKGVRSWRSFSPDRIRTVHWKEKIRS